MLKLSKTEYTQSSWSWRQAEEELGSHLNLRPARRPQSTFSLCELAKLNMAPYLLGHQQHHFLSTFSQQNNWEIWVCFEKMFIYCEVKFTPEDSSGLVA